jgi:cytochrome d ubiquinol oxidase subunit I
MLLAAYIVAGFVIAGVYAVALLKGRRDRYHRLGLLIPLTVAAVATPVQIVVGDIATRQVFHLEPAKFAAIELLPHTGSHVPETLGGVLVDGTVRYGVRIPDAASLLAGFHPATEIKGLDAVPASVRPDAALVSLVHLSFDVMVGASFVLLALSVWFTLAWWRRRELPWSRWFLRGVAVSGVVAVVALEAGWIVTEVGRQPWTVVSLLLTRDAVRTSGNLWPLLGATVVLYAAVGCGAVLVLREMRRRWHADTGTVDVPYGPGEPS